MSVDLVGKYEETQESPTTEDLVSKYDGIAERFAEGSYANLDFYMERRFIIATTWGKALSAGDSILELGCGDGYLARLLAEHGLRYRGVDMSPKMIAMAKRRLMERGLTANFMVADVSQMSLAEPCDAVIAYMRSFFTYVRQPLTLLKQLRPYIRKKIIIDLEPRRTISIKTAIDIMQKAGFENVRWRPFFVPEEKKLPPPVLKTLVACEDIPLLRRVPLRWKFLVLLKGEVG
jgi:2-polyprenyl-3-methyl-5-hydroxy-6-metoxy-1,4-benzoquinol methylase